MQTKWLAALALIPTFALANASTLDGTWHIDGSIEDHPVKPTCTIAEKDQKLTGTCTGTDGKDQTITGSIKDKTINWQYDTVYQSDPITLIFSGTIDKDSHITGTVSVEPMQASGNFTAQKDGDAPSK